MLPAGYVLNRDKSAQKDTGDEDSEEELTLEEKIEEERAALPSDGLTPVTLESFMKWKADKAAAKQRELEERIAAEEAKGRKDKGQMQFMSGRALFSFNPDLFEDDANAAADDIFEDDEAEESKAGQAQAAAAEETKEEVKVDADLFADDAGADEDVDFD